MLAYWLVMAVIGLGLLCFGYKVLAKQVNKVKRDKIHKKIKEGEDAMEDAKIIEKFDEREANYSKKVVKEFTKDAK